MKTNISIELSDAERNVIANLLKGKETKSMVTRSELSEMVQGFVQGILGYEPTTTAAKVVKIGFSPINISAKLQQSLDNHGYHESHPSRLGYVRGWNAVGK
tara:strand:+ start:68 stop:370 length:303 start_codon:yes stop_codon:yes gene_type:complete